MKKINKITILIISFFIFSCNNDDDQVSKEYFLTKITTTLPSSTTSSGTTNIQYDSKNRISQFSYQNVSQTYIFEVDYNTENLITSIISTKTSSTGTNILTFNCTYTNAILSQIIISNGAAAIPYNFIYDNASNKYTIESTSTTPDYYKYDSNENIIEFYFSGLLANFEYNNNKGIYNHTNNNLPLLFANLVNMQEESLYSYLFTNKEMTTMTFSLTNNFNSTITRNEENNISEVEIKNTASGETVFSSTMDYEPRTIN